MTNHEWDDMAAQWDGLEVGDPDLLQRRLRRHVRWNRLGLAGEGVALLAAIGVMAWAWNDAPGSRDWLIAAAVMLAFCQGLYLFLRRRYRLFEAPGNGLVGLIDAELGRARFVIASHWYGLPLGLLLLALAWTMMPSAFHERLLSGSAVAGALYLPYLAVRTWQMVRRISRLRRERATLAE